MIMCTGQMTFPQTQPSAHDLKPEVTRDCSSVDFSKVRVMSSRTLEHQEIYIYI